MNKDQIVKIAVEAGVKAAMDYMEEQKRKEVRSRRDKRLRNTRLLLKNYNTLKEHCRNAIYSKVLAEEAGSPIEILGEVDDYGNDTYIESIKKSAVRTHIIITHVDEMLKLYKIYCANSEKPEDQRRYRVLWAAYFQGMRPADIWSQEEIDERTYYRDINAGVEKLSALIFGFDGLSDVSERCQ